MGERVRPLVASFLCICQYFFLVFSVMMLQKPMGIERASSAPRSSIANLRNGEVTVSTLMSVVIGREDRVKKKAANE